MPINDPWKTALFDVRAQIADYEREGTSTPGKLKRAARLRAARMAIRDAAPAYANQVNAIKFMLNEIEAAEKEGQHRQIALRVRHLLAAVDGMIGANNP